MLKLRRAAFVCGAMLLSVPVFAGASPQAVSPWVAMTKADLQAMHDLMAANHPGMPDPENLRFKTLVEQGFAAAMQRADKARSYSDYLLDLKAYQISFQDGHVGLGTSLRERVRYWPGFKLYGSSLTSMTVTEALPDAGVKTGARLISCDGLSVEALLAKYADPYYWNRAIPHDRFRHINQIFQKSPDQKAEVLKSCTFSSGKVALKWRAKKHGKAGAHHSDNPFALQKLDGVWMLSLPSFDAESPAMQKKLKKLLAEVKQQAAELRKGPLIIDVRGNTGGSSLWGREIAETLWGRALRKAVEQRFDADVSVDWRVSPDNLAHFGVMLRYLRGVHDPAMQDFIEALSKLQKKMKAALAAGKPYVHEAGEDSKPLADKLPSDPVTGKVFFLTDNSCASACLDFADLVLHMPSVTHIGLPTYADTMYLEVDQKRLPSGLAKLYYPVKVYRGRKRGNNQWYSPKYRWPYDEPMIDDDKIIKWIKGLPE